MDTQDPTHEPLVGVDTTATETRFPSDGELIRGKPFFRGEFYEDVREFCNRLETALAERNIPLPAEMVLVLGGLRAKPNWDDLHALARYLDDDSQAAAGASLQSYRRRCRYYLAAAGDPDAAAFITQEASILALEDIKSAGDLHMIPIALSWAVTAYFIAELSQSAFVETSVGSVEHLRRNVLRSFERAVISKAPEPLDEKEGTLPDVLPQVSDGDGSPRLEREVAVRFRSNVLPFPVDRDPSQRRITLTVAELVDILKAANTAPESLSAALAAAGNRENPHSPLPDGTN